MPIPTQKKPTKAPGTLCDLFLRDLTSLLVTSRAITRSLLTLRPECGFSPEIIGKIDDLIAIAWQGENHLRTPLREAGIVLPAGVETRAGGLVTSLFGRLPAGAAHGVLGAEVVVNLRLIAQHLELKAQLAAEEARLVGQKSVRAALLAWARDWWACGQNLRAPTLPSQVPAYIGDLGGMATPLTS